MPDNSQTQQPLLQFGILILTFDTRLDTVLLLLPLSRHIFGSTYNYLVGVHLKLSKGMP